MSILLPIIAYILMFLGLIGAVIPLLPGAPLIWLGAFVWGWADGFQAFGWPTLLILAALAALSWCSDLIVTTFVSRKAGAGWQGVLAAIAGGIAGALLGGVFIPIAGAILGTMLGAATAMLLVEYRAKRNWALAWQAAGAYIIGYLVSSFVQIAICLAMIGVFVVQALL
jgi:hypothetical protein